MKLLPGFTTFDDVFDNMFDDPFFRGTRTTNLMKTDVKEIGDNYQLEMEVPGFAKEDISIELHDGYLNISAKKSSDNDQKDNDGNIIRRERYSGSCSRSLMVISFVANVIQDLVHVASMLVMISNKKILKQVTTMVN